MFFWIISGVTPTPSCLIHFKGEKGPLTCFTEISIKKVLTSHELWLKLDGEQRGIADKTVHILKSHENLQCPSNLYYHRTCYSKFTNVTFIKRADVRCVKQRETSEMATTNDQESEDGTGPSRKLLRSSMAMSKF